MVEKESVHKGSGCSTGVVRFEDLQATVDALVAKALSQGPSSSTGRYSNKLTVASPERLVAPG